MTPGGIYKIPYSTDGKHKKVLDAVRRRWDLSYRKMQNRYDKWNQAEDQFVAYIHERDTDATRRRAREQGQPQYTTIAIPYSYAQLLSAHTYWASVFLSRAPVFQFQGRHGETEDAIMAVEAVLDYQLQVGAMLVPLYLWLMDMGKYGFGVVGNYWEREEIVVSEIVERPKKYLGIVLPTGATEKVRQTRRMTGYEGNRLYNIRPADWFPDPRVTVANFQKGEFCGAYSEIGWNTVLKREAAGQYYNVDEAKRAKFKDWMRDRAGSSRIERPRDAMMDLMTGSSPGGRGKMDSTDFVGLLEMVVELVPKDWELGASEYPEKWVFSVINDEVIVSCQPLGMNHNKFPYSIQEYEIEGYGLAKRGMMEMIKPLNDVLEWLFNSHFHNVRKVLNDQYIVDPSRVVMKDMLDPNPGKMIRLKPAAYGSDVRTVISQLQTVDVTQTHMRDAQVVESIIKIMTGVSDSVMGNLSQGGRKTATEVRSSGTHGINRLRTNCEYSSAQGWAPLAQMMLQNTQQFYTDQKKFRIAGDLMKRAETFLDVGPENIVGFFDFVPVDGSMPVDKFALATLWKDLMAQMKGFPELLARYDIAEIFNHVGQLAGIKNLKRFQISVQPDEALAAQAQAGNLIPLRGGRGGPGPTGGSPGERGITAPAIAAGERPPQTTQLAGLGPVA